MTRRWLTLRALQLTGGSVAALVEEFLEMLRFSSQPMPDGARVCLWLEPAGYAIDAIGTDDPRRAVVRVFFDESFVPPMRRREMSTSFECEVDAASLGSALASSLSRLFQHPGADALNLWNRNLGREGYVQRFNSQPTAAG